MSTPLYTPYQTAEMIRELRQALETLISVGMEFYDMECGESGGRAIEEAREALEHTKEFA